MDFSLDWDIAIGFYEYKGYWELGKIKLDCFRCDGFERLDGAGGYLGASIHFYDFL